MAGILQIWAKEAIKYHYQQKARRIQQQDDMAVLKSILQKHKIK